MKYGCATLLILVLCCAERSQAAQTIILTKDDNLQSAIATAPHGSIIELHSSGAFSGSLSWQNKHLTIQAGPGYQPTIQGGVLNTFGNSSTGVTLRGLTLNSGVVASATGDRFATYVLEDTRVLGALNLSGTGNFHVDLTAQNSEFLGGTTFGGTGEFSIDAKLKGNVFDGVTRFSPIGNVNYDLDFVENDFRTRPLVAGVGNLLDVDYLFERNQLREGVEIVADSFDKLRVRMHDNLLGGIAEPPTSSSTGILLRTFYDTIYYADVDLYFRNNSVLGFDTGIDIRGFNEDIYPTATDIQFVNMLLWNRQDLANVDPADISYSLIADGTYDGLNSNFSGTPLLRPDGQLRLGSIGIDRGTNLNASAIDFAGNARIVDGNRDGLALVDVGAYESVVPEPTGQVLLLLGWLCLGVHRQRAPHRR